MRVEGEIQESELASMAAVYSLDIGVYFATRAGTPGARTRAAWARLDHCPGNLAAVRAGGRSGTALELTCESGRPVDTDRDLPRLVSRLPADLSARRWVALGFEAPMWFPVYTAGPAPGDPLFPCRCKEERTREWYLQSGAAATLKAIGLGTWLFSLLHKELPDLRFTTEPEEWRRRPERLLLSTTSCSAGACGTYALDPGG